VDSTLIDATVSGGAVLQSMIDHTPADGFRFGLVNNSTSVTLVVEHEAGATGINFLCPGAVDLEVLPHAVVWFVYVANVARFQVEYPGFNNQAGSIAITDSGGNYTATDVEGALAEIADDLDAHLADTADAHDASAISFDATGLSNTDADDVQEAIADLDAALVGLGSEGTKAWLNYNGVGNSIRGEFNVDSVTDNGTGDYTVNWDTDFADGNYCVVGMGSTDETTYNTVPIIKNASAPAASNTRVLMFGVSAYFDTAYTMIAAFGAQ
jgi:hypothetical protein